MDSIQQLSSYSKSVINMQPDDVIILTVAVVCSEPVLSVMFRLFKC